MSRCDPAWPGHDALRRVSSKSVQKIQDGNFEKNMDNGFKTVMPTFELNVPSDFDVIIFLVETVFFCLFFKHFCV